MKYIKMYENYKNEIEEGDYVIIKTNKDNYPDRYNRFLSTHIAKIFEMVGPGDLATFIYVYFEFDENDPEENANNFIQPFKVEEIKYSSKNKEELKLKLDAEKYNL